MKLEGTLGAMEDARQKKKKRSGKSWEVEVVECGSVAGFKGTEQKFIKKREHRWNRRDGWKNCRLDFHL